MSSLANLLVNEGTVNGELTIDFPMRFRKVTITNDSGSGNLQFKFNGKENFATLHPTETISLTAISGTVIISGAGIDYRILGIG